MNIPKKRVAMNLMKYSFLIILFIILPLGVAYSMPPLQTPFDKPLIGPVAQNVIDLNTSPAVEENATEEKERWSDVFDLAAAFEFEFHRVRDFSNHWYSSFQNVTAELDFSIYVNDWVSALVSIESDVDNNDIMTMKEGYFTVGSTDDYPYFLKAGYQYVSFGLGDGAILGDTLTISDPLTIEIFETRTSAAMAGRLWDDYQVGVYALDRSFYNPHHTQFGISLDKGKESEDFTYNFGIDFLTSVYETDGLFDAVPEALAVHRAPAISVHGRYFKNHISFITEGEAAFHHSTFTQDDIDYDIQPAAWMAELGYVREFYGMKSYAAIDYSESYGLQGLFAKNRVLGVVGIWFLENTLLAFEVGYENDYSVSNGGTGNSGQTFIMQLAVEI